MRGPAASIIAEVLMMLLRVVLTDMGKYSNLIAVKF